MRKACILGAIAEPQVTHADSNGFKGVSPTAVFGRFQTSHACAYFRRWLKAAVQRCPRGLPLSARKPTFERRRPIFGLFRLFHLQERTYPAVPPLDRFCPIADICTGG